jgi:hypothetical protein
MYNCSSGFTATGVVVGVVVVVVFSLPFELVPELQDVHNIPRVPNKSNVLIDFMLVDFGNI